MNVYGVTIMHDGAPTGVRRELTQDWVIPWVAALADIRGVDLVAELDHEGSEETRRMQALMIANQRGWIRYHWVMTAPGAALPDPDQGIDPASLEDAR